MRYEAQSHYTADIVCAYFDYVGLYYIGFHGSSGARYIEVWTMNSKKKSWQQCLLDAVFVLVMTAAISFIFGFFSGHGAYFAGKALGYIIW